MLYREKTVHCCLVEKTHLVSVNLTETIKVSSIRTCKVFGFCGYANPQQYKYLIIAPVAIIVVNEH